MIELSAVLLLVGVCLMMHFVMHGRRGPAREAAPREEHESHHDHRKRTGHGCH